MLCYSTPNKLIYFLFLLVQKNYPRNLLEHGSPTPRPWTTTGLLLFKLVTQQMGGRWVSKASSIFIAPPHCWHFCLSSACCQISSGIRFSWCCSVAKQYLTLWPQQTAAHQASLSFTISWSFLKLKSIESMMPSNHLILCHPFSSCPQSSPASGSFPMNQPFTSGGLMLELQHQSFQWIFRIDYCHRSANSTVYCTGEGSRFQDPYVNQPETISLPLSLEKRSSRKLVPGA